MLYLRGVTYGVGKELRWAPGAVVVAEDDARFKSVNGNPRGVTFTTGSEWLVM